MASYSIGGMNESNHLLILLLVIYSFIIILIIYRRDRKILASVNENYEDSASWRQWRVWTLRRLWRQTSSYLINGIISPIIPIIKTSIAIFSSWVAWEHAREAKIVAGATVFYAAMILFKGSFNQAALKDTSSNALRLFKENNEYIEWIDISINLKNAGQITAEDVLARARIVDPTRNINSGIYTLWENPVNNNEGNKIKPRRDADYNFLIAPDKDINKEILKGNKWSWIEIKIDTPDQLYPTWNYTNFQDENVEIKPVDNEMENISI